MADFLPKRRQRMDGVENAAQKSHRHDDEVLKSRHLVKLFRPQSRNHAERAQHRRTQHGKDNDPERRNKSRLAKKCSDHKHAQADQQAACH